MTETSATDAYIDRIRQGDVDAYAEVVRLTQDRLRAYILWFCPGSDAVDDIAQEVYLYAYRSIEKYETGTNMLAWLKTIARFRALNRARALSARAKREGRYFEHVMFDAAAASEAPDRGDRRLVFLRECLEELPPEGRKLVQYRYEKKLDMGSLGGLMDRSSGAIRARLLRIRNALRRCVESKMLAEGATS